MIATRVLFFLLIIILFLPFFRITYTNQLRILEKIILLSLMLFGLALTIKPDILSRIAYNLKIERRQDLLLYLYILGSSWGLIRSHIRINTLSSKINQIISELALYTNDKYR